MLSSNCRALAIVYSLTSSVSNIDRFYAREPVHTPLDSWSHRPTERELAEQHAESERPHYWPRARRFSAPQLGVGLCRDIAPVDDVVAMVVAGGEVIPQAWLSVKRMICYQLHDGAHPVADLECRRGRGKLAGFRPFACQCRINQHFVLAAEGQSMALQQNSTASRNRPVFMAYSASSRLSVATGGSAEVAKPSATALCISVTLAGSGIRAASYSNVPPIQHPFPRP